MNRYSVYKPQFFLRAYQSIAEQLDAMTPAIVAGGRGGEPRTEPVRRRTRARRGRQGQVQGGRLGGELIARVDQPGARGPPRSVRSGCPSGAVARGPVRSRVVFSGALVDATERESSLFRGSSPSRVFICLARISCDTGRGTFSLHATRSSIPCQARQHRRARVIVERSRWNHGQPRHPGRAASGGDGAEPLRLAVEAAASSAHPGQQGPPPQVPRQLQVPRPEGQDQDRPILFMPDGASPGLPQSRPHLGPHPDHLETLPRVPPPAADPPRGAGHRGPRRPQHRRHHPRGLPPLPHHGPGHHLPRGGGQAGLHHHHRLPRVLLPALPQVDDHRQRLHGDPPRGLPGAVQGRALRLRPLVHRQRRGPLQEDGQAQAEGPDPRPQGAGHFPRHGRQGLPPVRPRRQRQVHRRVERHLPEKGGILQGLVEEPRGRSIQGGAAASRVQGLRVHGRRRILPEAQR